MRCKKCNEKLNEHYMICKNCETPRTPLEAWELKLWKAAQTEIERLKAELKNKNDMIICAKALCHKLLIKHPVPTKKHFGGWEVARMVLGELSKKL